MQEHELLLAGKKSTMATLSLRGTNTDQPPPLALSRVPPTYLPGVYSLVFKVIFSTFEVRCRLVFCCCCLCLLHIFSSSDNSPVDFYFIFLNRPPTVMNLLLALINIVISKNSRRHHMSGTCLLYTSRCV